MNKPGSLVGNSLGFLGAGGLVLMQFVFDLTN